ncbi:putative C2 domain-containing protein [Rosa chinensis]|uniref:Putative C2 domain-containing protein n=1 Tax=Rosa chinensis TaxID=74649 RepID=A0A2P6SH21_ROSCH|nr:putative C2 domain-containing protein [Rosa chinensis]
MWNEDLMFVAAEPFDDHLIISVEDRVGSNKDETLGRVVIPLNTVERRADDRNIRGRWYNLEKHMSDAMELEGEQRKKDKERDKFSSRIHLRICLDGGYHVLDESTHYSSDLRPTAKPLWKSSIGVLELGILMLMVYTNENKDGKGTSDTYCVAKMGTNGFVLDHK